MSDLYPRRRLAGRALLGAGLLALPLTASITFAASETVQEMAEPPAPPSPPASPEAPAAPAAPGAPEAPDVPDAPSILVIDPDLPAEEDTDPAVTGHVGRGPDGTPVGMRMVFRSAPDRLMLSHVPGAAAGLDPAEREAVLADLRKSLAEVEELHVYLPKLIEDAMADARTARIAAAAAPRVIVQHACRPGSEDVTETESRDGVQVVTICQSRVFASARQGLEEARAEIARDRTIPEDTRKQVLRTLDRQIERWSGKEG